MQVAPATLTMQKIKFIRSGCCTVIGSFSPGDVATVHTSLAVHLVSQAMVAEFLPSTEQCVSRPEPPSVARSASLKPLALQRRQVVRQNAAAKAA
jgi:hypothetical protein